MPGTTPDSEQSSRANRLGRNEDPGQITAGKGKRHPCNHCGSHREHQRESFGRCTRGTDVRLSGGPFATKGKDLSLACVRPSKIERPVGVLRQRDRKLRVRHGGVPVTSSKMGVTQVRETRDRIRRGQPGAHSGRRDAEVRDRTRQSHRRTPRASPA